MPKLPVVSGRRLAARPAGSHPGDAGRVRPARERPGRVPQFRDSDRADRGQVGARRRVSSERPQGRASRDLRAGAGWTPGGARRRRRPAGLRRDGDPWRRSTIAAIPVGLGGWAVGATPMMFPEGLAARLPKGSDFLLQMHFHLTGKPETEKSLIGIYFADQARRRRTCFPSSCRRSSALVPASTFRPARSSTRFRIRSRCRATCSVYSAMAHAHYLAREMKATATLPDGSTRPMIWINDWDFNWQDSYVYKEPFTLPKGTRIDVTLTLRQLRRQPAQSDQSAAARALGRAVVRRDGDGRLYVRSAAAKRTCRRSSEALAARNKAAIAAGRQERHAAAVPGAPAAAEPRPAAADHLRSAGDDRRQGG